MSRPRRPLPSGTRHLKLDFKEMAAVEPCLQLLAARWPKLRANGQGVWLNADVLPGPNARRRSRMPAEEFVPLCRRMCPHASLSLGWQLGVIGREQGYAESDATEMLRVCLEHQCAATTKPHPPPRRPPPPPTARLHARAQDRGR